MKKYIPHLLIALFTTTQSIAIVLRIDVWPFSCYPMFSEPKIIDQIESFQLRSIKKNGEIQQISLPGHKQTWVKYHTLSNKKDFLGLQSEMRKDYEKYAATQKHIHHDKISELRLFRVGIKKKNTNGEFVIEEKLIFALNI